MTHIDKIMAIVTPVLGPDGTLYKQLRAAVEAMQAELQQPWRDARTSKPAVTPHRGGWEQSKRVVLRIVNGPEVNTVFGVYTRSTAIPGEWRPEGYNGNWSDRVTHWMELPELKGDSKNG